MVPGSQGDPERRRYWKPDRLRLNPTQGTEERSEGPGTQNRKYEPIILRLAGKGKAPVPFISRSVVARCPALEPLSVKLTSQSYHGPWLDDCMKARGRHDAGNDGSSRILPPNERSGSGAGS